MERCGLAKKKAFSWRDVGLLAVAAFAWSKLGVGETVKEVVGGIRTTALKPDGSCPAGFYREGNKCVRFGL